MKVFLRTEQGETGPFSPAQINRQIARGEAQPTQLCRVEGIPGTRPLREQFRHLAPKDPVVVAEARARVREYNLRAGRNLMLIGAGCVLGGFNQLIVSWDWIYGPRAIGLCLAGVIVLCQGAAQRRRAHANRRQAEA